MFPLQSQSPHVFLALSPNAPCRYVRGWCMREASALGPYTRFYCAHLLSPAQRTPESRFHTGLNWFQFASCLDWHVLLQSRLCRNWMAFFFFHMAGHVLSLCLVMLPDKQANIKKNKPAPHPPNLQSQAYLKRSTCSPRSKQWLGRREPSQSVNLLLQRGLHVQTAHSPAQAEIPTGLKRIAFWGDNDCVCQSGLPRLYYTVSSVECLHLLNWSAYSSSYHQETRSRGHVSCYTVWSVYWSETQANSSIFYYGLHFNYFYCCCDISQTCRSYA